jgi:hypothetical protein
METTAAKFLLLILPIIDLHQPSEDYVKEIECEKDQKNNNKISLKICSKPEVNLKIR